ncbi:primosomal protein N' [Acetobacter sp. AN02]|uniref:primosomal protein N' n=1 Tax=Acetobacter sp. AN02 TaxID=2894186 RepID=UPI0024344950|nr:primosomal protein N' [Acetobacter sp. AN02]MDG6095549.1 primosomal protein N' [Acetobacter sp. AN02]
MSLFPDLPDTARRRRVSVLLPLPFPGTLDYALADTQDLRPGDIVSVPLSGRKETGVVWEHDGTLPPELDPQRNAEPQPDIPDNRLRAVSAKLDIPPLPEALRRFIDWVAAYTLASPGMVLALCLRAHLRGAEARPLSGWTPADPLPEALRLTPARQAILTALQDAPPLTTAALAKRSGSSPAVIRGLAEARAILPVTIGADLPFGCPEPGHNPPSLAGQQAEVAQNLRTAVTENRFSVTLLEGVTGSGKTEVCLEAIAACLEAGKQALILLPEIALSAQWTERFARRFGTRPAIWHSELGPKIRALTWTACMNGTARVIVGARSALFLPLNAPGLIIVDEEHETAFKQEDGVMYNARDMAVVRARQAGIPIVLVSATPGLETLTNARSGRYRHLSLTSRHGGASLPRTRMIDLRENPPPRGCFLSPALTDALADTFAKKEQAMLFLNRRGYAPLTLCRTCGHRFECPDCTSWLVEHRARRILACHHCEHTEPVPDRCPSCSAEHTLTPVGPGIERITEEARTLFPEARILVMASDIQTTPAAMTEAIRSISDRETDLIIGTQIVAKGWHFPHLTLVGVVDADLGLGGADLRAGERTIQLLHQVAGRAGRAEAAGTVMFQSFSPEHPVMQALISGDFQAFMEQESRQRQPGFWPPFGRLAALIVSSSREEDADNAARTLGMAAPQGEGIQVLGPAPAPLALLRGRHRRRLLLRTRRHIAVQPVLRHWLSTVSLPSSVRVDIDVDPVSFM